MFRGCQHDPCLRVGICVCVCVVHVCLPCHLCMCLREARVSSQRALVRLSVCRFLDVHRRPRRIDGYTKFNTTPAAIHWIPVLHRNHLRPAGQRVLTLCGLSAPQSSPNQMKLDQVEGKTTALLMGWRDGAPPHGEIICSSIVSSAFVSVRLVSVPSSLISSLPVFVASLLHS